MDFQRLLEQRRKHAIEDGVFSEQGVKDSHILLRTETFTIRTDPRNFMLYTEDDRTIRYYADFGMLLIALSRDKLRKQQARDVAGLLQVLREVYGEFLKDIRDAFDMRPDASGFRVLDETPTTKAVKELPKEVSTTPPKKPGAVTTVKKPHQAVKKPVVAVKKPFPAVKKPVKKVG